MATPIRPSRMAVVPSTSPPLKEKWTLWVVYPEPRIDSWTDNLNLLCSLETCDQVYRTLSSIKAPIELPLGTSYMVFHDGVQPMWEDPVNENGGRWLFKDSQLRGLPNRRMSSLWLEVLNLALGGWLGKEAVGVVFGKKRHSLVSLWTTTTDQQIVMEIGRKLKAELPDCGIEFRSHRTNDSSAGENRARQPLYCL